MGDRILVVNGVDIFYMYYEDIVNFIKDTGYLVILIVGFFIGKVSVIIMRFFRGFLFRFIVENFKIYV